MNVANIENCYGCGVCATICPTKIINISLNKDGFYEPNIKELDKCTECSLCTDVCAFLHEDLSLQNPEITSYAAWSKEDAVRKKCSSGGVGFELGRILIEEDYKVCGVKYSTEKGIAEHYIATTVEELIPTIGSKYIQSYTVDGFKAINRKEKYLVTGTPCQIDSFRRYIRKFRVEDNFVLMDFFCHSVPSMHAWKKYLKLVEPITGKVNYASWRNKFTGWHDATDAEKQGESVNWHDSYNILIKGKNKLYNSRLSQGDLFYKFFLGDYCCNPACNEKCKYKYNRSSADIRIGDLWGKTYAKDEKGVSALISFTAKGKLTIDKMRDCCTLIRHPFEIVAEGQMKRNAKKAYLANVVKQMLQSPKEYSEKDYKLIFKMERVLHLPQRITNKFKRILNL